DRLLVPLPGAPSQANLFFGVGDHRELANVEQVLIESTAGGRASRRPERTVAHGAHSTSKGVRRDVQLAVREAPAGAGGSRESIRWLKYRTGERAGQPKNVVHITISCRTMSCLLPQRYAAIAMCTMFIQYHNLLLRNKL